MKPSLLGFLIKIRYKATKTIAICKLDIFLILGKDKKIKNHLILQPQVQVFPQEEVSRHL